MNPKELVTYAEAAMLTAKAKGGNRVVLFDDAKEDRPGIPSASRGTAGYRSLYEPSSQVFATIAGRIRLAWTGRVGERPCELEHGRPARLGPRHESAPSRSCGTGRSVVLRR